MALIEKENKLNHSEWCTVQLGYVTQILMLSERSQYHIGLINYLFMPAIRTKQIHILLTNVGVPIACATWAYLSDQVSNELANDSNRPLYHNEWNEGTNLWMIDIMAPLGHLRSLVNQLRPRFRGVDRIRGIRRNADGTIRRVADLHLVGRRDQP